MKSLVRKNLVAQEVKMAASQNPLSPPTLLDRFFIYGAGPGWRWIDAVDMFEFGGLRRHGAHRSSDMLILSTVAQTSSPRHSPGWPDLKLSPHPI